MCFIQKHIWPAFSNILQFGDYFEKLVDQQMKVISTRGLLIIMLFFLLNILNLVVRQCSIPEKKETVIQFTSFGIYQNTWKGPNFLI